MRAPATRHFRHLLQGCHLLLAEYLPGYWGRFQGPSHFLPLDHGPTQSIAWQVGAAYLEIALSPYDSPNLLPDRYVGCFPEVLALLKREQPHPRRHDHSPWPLPARHSADIRPRRFG